MAEQLTLNIKAPGDVKLAVNVSAEASVKELKEAIAAQNSDLPADGIRLIFSGRILKDEDPLSKYSIKTGVAIHLVKSARPAAAAGGSGPTASSEAAGVPSNFAAGQQVAGNPLAPLMNAQYAGAFGGFNPFAEMGINPNDPNYVQQMMQSPEAQAQMQRLLSDPALVDQIIQSNPQLQAMGPQVRQIMQSEHFRNFLANPQMMQQMMGMMGGGGGAGGAGAFPPPGAFGWGSGAQGGQQQGQQAAGGMAPSLFNPWASTPTPAAGAEGAATPAAGATGTGGAGSPPPAFNPFAMLGGAEGTGGAGGQGYDPMQALAQLQQMNQLFGGMGGASGAGAGAGAGGAPQQSPEERYAVELEQLRNMGFTDASRNVRALLAAGGFVDSAVEWLLSNP
ncbi:hypothetical protein JCM11251_004544 [Rhodosporidiobolus azoricus]